MSYVSLNFGFESVHIDILLFCFVMIWQAKYRKIQGCWKGSWTHSWPKLKVS